MRMNCIYSIILDLGRGWGLSVCREEATSCISCTKLQSLMKKNVRGSGSPVLTLSVTAALPASYQDAHLQKGTSFRGWWGGWRSSWRSLPCWWPSHMECLIMDYDANGDDLNHEAMQTMYKSLCLQSNWQQCNNGSPVLTAVALKHGLHDGIWDQRSRWESRKVQKTVSGGREGRIRIRIREGRRMREEVSMVALSRDWSSLDLAVLTEGVNRERANDKKV